MSFKIYKAIAWNWHPSYTRKQNIYFYQLMGKFQMNSSFLMIFKRNWTSARLELAKAVLAAGHGRVSAEVWRNWLPVTPLGRQKRTDCFNGRLCLKIFCPIWTAKLMDKAQSIAGRGRASFRGHRCFLAMTYQDQTRCSHGFSGWYDMPSVIWKLLYLMLKDPVLSHFSSTPTSPTVFGAQFHDHLLCEFCQPHSKIKKKKKRHLKA